VPDPGEAVRIDRALLKAPSRTISRGSQKVAKVKLACSEAGLIFHAHYLQPVLKPNPETPWTGTALELIAYQCAPEGTPHWKMPERRQVFLVPLEDGILVRRLDALGTGTEPAPLVKATSKPVEGGWDIAAIIPWQEFGMEKRPKDFPFDLIVDALDPQNEQLTQISAFDLPSDGWRRLYGKLICGK
jgi:hypothetical protein